LPDGASLERTQKALEKVSEIAGQTPGVAQVTTIAGISALDNSASLANAGVAYIVLKDWDARGKGEDLRSLVYGLNDKMAAVMEAQVSVLPPPPIQGIGNAAGFSMQVELRDGNNDYAKLQALTSAIVASAQSQSALQRVQSPFRAMVPQFDVEIDRIKTQTLHVTTDQVFSALSSYLGSSYVNQFNKFGRVFQVYVQADASARLTTREIENLMVRNQSGDMIPLGTVATITSERRPLADQPVQSLSVRHRRRPAGARLQLRAIADTDGAGRGSDLTAGRRLRVDRDVLSGEGGLEPDLPDLRSCAAAGLSGARRPI
jgi:HAE1 family hydrophobic/amphiphilic exporter-1